MNFRNSIIFTLPKVFNRAFGKYKIQIAILSFLSFINSILEGIGISAVIPIFSFVSNEGTKGSDIISKTIERIFNFVHIGYSVRNLLIFIGVLFIFKVIIIFFTQYITVKVIADYQKNTKTEIFKSILKSNWPYLSKQKLGHLDQVMTTNVNNISSMFSCFSTSVLIVAKIVIYSVIAINISLIVTLSMFALGAFSFFIFKPLFYKSKEISSKSEDLNRITSHYINENILGMKTVKSMNVEKGVLSKINNYFDLSKKLTLDLVITKGITDVILQIIGVGFILSAFIFFYKTVAFNFATFAVMVYAVNQIFTQIQAMQEQMHRFVSNFPYLNKVFEYLDQSIMHKELDKGTRDFSFKEKLEFKNVLFYYNSKNNILNNITFEIKKGEMIGLIGPSGAGKTTIVDLLLRLYSPISGEILIDNNRIEKINLKSWRENIGYVSQDIFLMNDTISNNIRFYDLSLTNNEIEDAAKMANISGFIQNLPEKYESIIGERGIMLSGGQRQRIIIARVLARKPKLLILDEATSALDNESEIEVQKVIEGLQGKITVLVIAHRLSTIINSDRLIALENGKIIESGSPKKLLKEKESYFAKVYNLRI